MTTAVRRSIRVPRPTTAALLAAVFTASVGYGVVLPLLPDLVERLLGTGVSPELVSRHTGLLTATYALALFVAAPAWGRLSDAHGRRNTLLAGLLGFSLGITVGSAAGGLLFNLGGVTGTSFVLTAGLVMVGLLLSLGLPRALVPDVTRHQAFPKGAP